MSSATERKLAAIMLADIAGFSSLMEKDESGTFDRVRVLREQLITPRVAEHGGRIIKTTGDGFLAEFPSATSALRCGVEIQRANHAQELSRPERERIHMRIGLNVGDIIIDGDDIAGDGVNIAARLEPLAPLDGICVSGTVREHIRQDLGIEYLDLGDQLVKNISRPIRAYQVNLTAKEGVKVKSVKRDKKRTALRAALPGIAIAAALAVGLVAWRGGLVPWNGSAIVPYSAQDLRMSFAVLPISAPDGDQATAAFANAVTEALMARQTDSPESRVVSRGSVEDALKKHTSAKELGRALNVHFLLRGNATRAGDGYKVTASIVDAESDRVLGTEEFSWPHGKAVHAYDLQIDRTVGLAVYSGFNVELARTKQKKSEDLDVRDLVYLARDAWNNDKASYDMAMSLLQRALALAPDNRLALKLLAEVNLDASRVYWSSNPQEQEKIGADAVERYIAKYPSDRAMTLQRMALYDLHGRFEDSLVLVDRLLEKNPEDPILLGERAYRLFKLGRSKEALVLVENVMRQDPSGNWEAFAAAVHYALGQNAEAADLARKAGAILSKAGLAHPEAGAVRLIQVAAEANLGHMQQARAAFADFAAAAPDARTISAIKKWMGPHADLAGYEPFYDGLRKAAVPE